MVDEDAPTLIEQYLMQLYGEHELDGSRALIPREVVLSHPLPDKKTVVELLSELRGSRVRVGTPARGPKRELLTTVEKTASQDLALHKLRRRRDSYPIIDG